MRAPKRAKSQPSVGSASASATKASKSAGIPRGYCVAGQVGTVAAAGNPCAAKKGEPAIQLRTRVVRVYERTQEPASGRYPLRCGGDDLGYLHLFARSAAGEGNHCDPVNDRNDE